LTNPPSPLHKVSIFFTFYSPRIFL
ncbi:hypothetical protein Pcinc_026076, partial [Petrolisthes cinctipes]